MRALIRLKEQAPDAARLALEPVLEALAGAGFREIVVLASRLEEGLAEAVGDGSRWDLNVRYLRLSGGGADAINDIGHALPSLGTAPFLVIDENFAQDFPLGRLRSVKCDYAHLVLRPSTGGTGDFFFRHGRVSDSGEPVWSFAGICVCHPRMFTGTGETGSLIELLRRTATTHLVTAEIHTG